MTVQYLGPWRCLSVNCAEVIRSIYRIEISQSLTAIWYIGRAQSIYSTTHSITLATSLIAVTATHKTAALSDSCILEGLDRANTARFSLELAYTILTLQLLDNTSIKGHLQGVRSGKSRLKGLPDLLLGVQLLLRLALEAIKEDTLAGLGVCRGVDQLDGALVPIILALFDLGACGEHHGAGLDAAHLDGFEVAYDDNLAALHLLERDEAVETRADGADDLAFVFLGIGGACRIAHGDGGDVEGVGVGVLDGLEDVADTQVDESGRERGGGWWGGFLATVLVLGLLLLLLALALASDGAYDGVLDLGDFFLGAVDQCLLLAALSSSSSSGSLGSLLLLGLLFLGLGVNGRLDVEDFLGVDLEFVTVCDGQTKQGAVLDKVEVADNMGVASLTGAFLG